MNTTRTASPSHPLRQSWPHIAHPARGISVMMMLLMASVGCAGKKKTSAAAPGSTTAVKEVATDADVDARVSGAKSIASMLASHVEPLPGHTTEMHVSAMRAVLDDLTLVLPLLKGQDQSGKWRQELQNIQNAANGLASLPPGAAYEPYTDSGLRAAADVLSEIVTSPIYAEADQQAALDALRTQLLELDRTKGAMHQLVVADAAAQVSGIVTALAGQFEKEAAPTAGATEAAPAAAATNQVAPPAAPADAPAAESTPAPATPAPDAGAPEATPPAPAPAPDAAAPAPEAPAPAAPDAAAPAPTPAPEEANK